MDAAILAGGRAQRLGGVPKALLELGGQRIIDRQVAVLAKLVEQVLLVVGDPSPYAGIEGVRVVLDHNPGHGPLAGLQAALHATEAARLMVFGCDLPFLDARLILQMRDRAHHHQAVVPRVGGRAQPLHACYARTILPVVETRLRSGALRMVDLLDELDVDWLEEHELRAIDPMLTGLTNVNSPAELAAARSLADR